MAFLTRKLIGYYFYLNEEVSDPRTNDWPMMNSPWPVVGILLTYLYFVFKIGPLYMENRKPYKLDKLLVGFNLVQIVACIYIVYKNLKLTWGKYSLICEPVDYSPNPDSLEIAGLIYFYFWVKLADLLDTVFFVLRKKNNQISFLHLYHHTGMVALAWGGTKFLAGGHSVYISTLNSSVHIVMYIYYLLTAWNADYKQSVWWKKHITQVQMVQFLMLIILYAQLLFQNDCQYPIWTALLFVPQNVFMLILFGDFYMKAYMKKKVVKDGSSGDQSVKDKTS